MFSCLTRIKMSHFKRMSHQQPALTSHQACLGSECRVPGRTPASFLQKETFVSFYQIAIWRGCHEAAPGAAIGKYVSRCNDMIHSQVALLSRISVLFLFETFFNLILDKKCLMYICGLGKTGIRRCKNMNINKNVDCS